MTLPERRRFVCLTFDGGYKDIMTQAYPVLSRHGVPFAIYLPTAFPDGLGEAWWLALEQIIDREIRVSLMIDRKERHFTVQNPADKYELYDISRAGCGRWRRRISATRSTTSAGAIRSTSPPCRARAAMDWDDLTRLAADPNVTIGSAAVNYPVLANLRDADAEREMAMGRAVAEAAFHRSIRHFAYPFGDRESWRRQHVVMAEWSASTARFRRSRASWRRRDAPISTRCPASPGTAASARCG